MPRPAEHRPNSSDREVPAIAPPPAGTVERFCLDLIGATRLADKVEPAPPPDPRSDASWEQHAPARRVAAPGRPPELEVVRKSPRTPPVGAWTRPEARARVLATCVHHELQAAELFAWAVLAFPREPRDFRAGLVRLCLEELEHLRVYAAQLSRLGFAVGAFPVRDWFWHRVPACTTAVQYVAFMGMGLEGGNLDHTERYAAWLRDVGDLEGAAIQDRVHREEIPHVRFGCRIINNCFSFSQNSCHDRVFSSGDARFSKQHFSAS